MYNDLKGKMTILRYNPIYWSHAESPNVTNFFLPAYLETICLWHWATDPFVSKEMWHMWLLEFECHKKSRQVMWFLEEVDSCRPASSTWQDSTSFVSNTSRCQSSCQQWREPEKEESDNNYRRNISIYLSITQCFWKRFTCTFRVYKITHRAHIIKSSLPSPVGWLH